MNERIKQIISLLLKEPNITITEMMQRLSLTRRQIDYAIKIINQKLVKGQFPTIKRFKNGVFNISVAVREALSQTFNDYLQDTYSDLDRQTLILIYLCFNNDYVSLDHLMSFLKYSKATISNDTRMINLRIVDRKLKVSYTRLQGYSLRGNEADILCLATKLVLAHDTLLSDAVVAAANPAKAEPKLATTLVMDIEKKFKTKFSDKYFNALKVIVQIILARKLPAIQTVDPFIADTSEYDYLRQCQALSSYNTNYIQWIALEVLSANVYDKAKTDYSPRDLKLLSYIHQMVAQFTAKTLVRLDESAAFELRLLNHLRPACYWVKFGLPSAGLVELAADQNNAILKDIMVHLVRPLEDWLGKPFPDQEVQLLTYYFGYLLTDKFGTSRDRKYKAVVVCSNGIIISKILLRQLNIIFPELNFLFTMSAREFESYRKNVDVVFSTVPLTTRTMQYLVTSNMSNTRKLELRYRVLNDLGLRKVDHKVQRIMQLIAKYADIKDLEKLQQGIERLLMTDDESQELEPQLPNLLAYVKPQYVQITQVE